MPEKLDIEHARREIETATESLANYARVAQELSKMFEEPEARDDFAALLFTSLHRAKLPNGKARNKAVLASLEARGFSHAHIQVFFSVMGMAISTHYEEMQMMRALMEQYGIKMPSPETMPKPAPKQ